MADLSIQMGLKFDADLAPIVTNNPKNLGLLTFLVGVQILRTMQKVDDADLTQVTVSAEAPASVQQAVAPPK